MQEQASNTKLFLGVLLGLAIGVSATYLMVRSSSGRADAAGSAADTMPLSPEGEKAHIQLSEAQKMIANYRKGDQILRIGSDTLQGWYIEKSEIDSVLRKAHPESEGVQFYLARKQAKGEFTLVWLASKDTVINGSAERWLVYKDELTTRSTIRQYVRPCPINCPLNKLY
jgi:hypothetical protein